MNAVLLAAALVPGVLAGGACPAPPKPLNHGNFQPGPGQHNLPAVTNSFSAIQPAELSKTLASLASAVPGAVSYLTGDAPGGYLTSIIPVPSGCSFLPQTTPSGSAAASTTASGAAYSTSAAAASSFSSGYASASASASSSGYASASSSPAAASGSASPSASASASSATHGKGSKASKVSSALAKSKTSASTSTKATTSAKATTSTKATSTKATSTSSQAANPTSTECSNPQARVEWRSLSPQQRTNFVQANQCLMLAPPRANFPAAKSRWDELVYIHQQMAPVVHEVGGFLAWHRQFVWTWEQELRGYCGYTDPLPWWDETQDTGNFANAPMFTSEYFGEAPVGNAQCITDGAFGNITLNIGPGTSETAHCLSRGISESDASEVNQGFVNQCNAYTNFDQMENCQFFGVHSWGHNAIGGVMSDIDSSPGDAIFYLHHGFIDNNWRTWQLVAPSQRTYAVGGYTTQQCLNGGAGCDPTTLNQKLSTLGYQPDVTIGQVADTQGGHLCYYYSS